MLNKNRSQARSLSERKGLWSHMLVKKGASMGHATETPSSGLHGEGSVPAFLKVVSSFMHPVLGKTNVSGFEIIDYR